MPDTGGSAQGTPQSWVEGPWNADAAFIDDEDFERLGTFGDTEVERFCRPMADPRRGRNYDPWISVSKFVLVGRRGLGKSHLLAFRSHNHRNADNGSTFFHPHGGQPRQLVEYLTQMGTISEKHWLRSRDAAGDWAALWQIAILGFLVWRLCDPEVRQTLRGYSATFARIKDLDEAFRRDDADDGDSATARAGPRLRWFLGAVIESQPSDRSSQRTLQAINDDAETFWALAVRTQLERSRKYKCIALYIDNPDELVTSQDQDVWLNVQQGLLLAIWKMRKGRVLEKLSVFASVRAEAMYERQHPDLKSALDVAIHLRYDKGALEDLFVSRIRLTSPHKMALPELLKPTASSGDVIKAFLGFNEYIHYSRLGAEGLPERERAMEALIRHSRLVPRELVSMGRAIASSDAGQLRTLDTVKAEVNKEAGEIVEYVKSNCFPPWTNAMTGILYSIGASVVPSERMRKIVEQHSSSTAEGWSHLRVLISLGLLGYAVPNTKRHRYCYTQKFVFHQDGHIVSPDTAFFFVHPATKEWIRARSGLPGGWDTETRVLIGHDLPYESRAPVVRLTVEHDQPTILVGGEVLQSNSRSDPIKFLFVSLLAWRLRRGKRSPTMNDLRKLCAQLSALKSFTIKPDAAQVPDNSPIRKWARTLNAMELVKRMQSEEEASTRQATSDKRRTGIVSIKAPEGAEASVMIMGLNAADIDVHDKINAALD